MAPWHLLEPKEEENLHKTRLLNVEERPFLRITKRMQTAHTIAKWGKPTPQQNGAPQSAAASQPTSPTTPASSAASTTQPQQPQQQQQQPDPAAAAELAALREEVTLDFAAFDFTVARFQSLLNANASERARYNADRQTILDRCASVRDSAAELRARLEAARAQLERRRRFDDLADRITSNRALRPRADQHHALAKLEDECASLEAESAQYAATWRERRDQFARIMDESMRLRRQIRDEADEVDRREGMGDEDNDAANDAADGQTPRPGVASGNVTPMPHGGGGGGGGSNHGLLPPKVVAGLAAAAEADPSRPASVYGGRTPARDSPAPQDMMLKPGDGGGGASGLSHAGSPPHSRDGTSAAGEDEGRTREDDVDMDDAGVVADDAPTSNDETRTMAVDTPRTEEKMDTT